MESSGWLAPLLLCAGFLCLTLVVVGGAMLVSELRGLRRGLGSGQNDLARRLRLVEARLDEIERREVKPEARAVMKDWRKEPPATARSGFGAAGAGDNPTLIAVPTLAPPSPEPRDGSENGPGTRHAEILALAAGGTSAGEIARRTGHPVGQVELILGLHRQLRTPRGSAEHARGG